MSEPSWEEIVERAAVAETEYFVRTGGAENYQYVIARLVREVNRLRLLLEAKDE